MKATKVVEFDHLDVRCSVRVFERYSIADKSRTSMNVVLLQKGNDEIYLTAITSGGGLSMFADNTETWGEASFLKQLQEILWDLIYKTQMSEE